MGVIKEPCVQNIWKNGTWLGAKDTFLKSTLHKMSKHILLNWQCKGQHAIYKWRFDFADTPPLFGQKILFWGFSNLINCWDITPASCSVTIMDRYKTNFVWINSEKRLELQKTPYPLHHSPLSDDHLWTAPYNCGAAGILHSIPKHECSLIFNVCVLCRLLTCAIKEENKTISMHSCCWRFY